MSKNNTDIDSYKFRHLTTSESDLDQYNALLRYAFQVTEQDLSETGWRDDEIKQSKFPVLHIPRVFGQRHHEEAHDTEPHKYAQQRPLVCASVSVLHPALS